MTPTLEELGIFRMSVPQRIALAQEILDSITADQPTPPLSDAKQRELQRRLADHAANPGDVIPWETIEAEAQKRWQP